LSGDGEICVPVHSMKALNKGEWLASQDGRFTPGERGPGTH